MDIKNRELLEGVIEERLRLVQFADPENEVNKAMFKEAMEALSKQIEFDKIDASHEEQLKKMEIEHEKNLRDEAARKSEAKKDRWVQIATFGAGLVVAPFIEHISKKAFARYICEFEKDYTFTTSAGRSLSSLFRFKK